MRRPHERRIIILCGRLHARDEGLGERVALRPGELQAHEFPIPPFGVRQDRRGSDLLGHLCAARARAQLQRVRVEKLIFRAIGDEEIRVDRIPVEASAAVQRDLRDLQRARALDGDGALMVDEIRGEDREHGGDEHFVLCDETDA